jgi:hypothetical protein
MLLLQWQIKYIRIPKVEMKIERQHCARVEEINEGALKLYILLFILDDPTFLHRRLRL